MSFMIILLVVCFLDDSGINELYLNVRLSSWAPFNVTNCIPMTDLAGVLLYSFSAKINKLYNDVWPSGCAALTVINSTTMSDFLVVLLKSSSKSRDILHGICRLWWLFLIVRFVDDYSKNEFHYDVRFSGYCFVLFWFCSLDDCGINELYHDVRISDSLFSRWLRF